MAQQGANPIFGREETALNGIFTSDKVKLQFSGDVDGVLVQGFNFTYSQQITRLYEIGGSAAPSNNGQQQTYVYYVGGRTQGAAQLNRVIGPCAKIVELYKQYGDVCKACNNPLTVSLDQTNCSPGEGGNAADKCGCDDKSLKYMLKHCVLTQVGVSIQAQDMIINETSQIMFSGLNYE